MEKTNDLVNLIAGLFEKLGLTGSWATLGVFLAIAVVAAIMVAFMAIFAGPVTWVERRVAGRMQSRIGPNRVGPAGILQWLADGVKNLLKEDLIPDAADPVLFRLAPYLVFAGMFGCFAALPFSAVAAAVDLNVGIFYILSITSLVVVGILFSGWGSNSKWALLGGMRAAAQIVSYEIPVGLALTVPILLSGQLSMQGIIRAQGGWPWQWYIFNNPFAFGAFFIFFIASLAEGNRTPFDIPEAESELVSGYNTEYSGFRFLAFLFAEWANLWIMASISVTAFLGGWQIPGVDYAAQAASIWLNVLGFLIFTVKASALVFVIIQLRWTLPRLRVDQMMNVCWKYLVPLSFACILATALWMFVDFHAPKIGLAMSLLMTALGFFLLGLLFWRARFNRVASGETPYRKIFT
jgi:NADH-quinone oxidoreductase subunit H